MVYSSSLSSPLLLVLISTLALIQAGNNNAQRHQADPVYLIAKNYSYCCCNPCRCISNCSCDIFHQYILLSSSKETVDSYCFLFMFVYVFFYIFFKFSKSTTSILNHVYESILFILIILSNLINNFNVSLSWFIMSTHITFFCYI